jgi:hypothetical protein
MKDIKEYKTTSEWYSDARKNNYSIPLAMCQGINTAQQKLNLDFSDIFELFIENKIIIKLDNYFIYNMKGYLGIRK